MANKDAIVTLKLLIQGSNAKAMRFGLDLSVGEVIKEIRAKHEIGGKDHGLFIPPNSETGKKAFWLAKNRTLRYYGLTNNSLVEFKKIHRPLKIVFVDDTRKMVVIDDTSTVSKICATIGEKIGLKSWEEFSLRHMPTVTPEGTTKPGPWLNDSQTLHDQDIKETDELEYCKRYFYNDDFIDKDDPFSLHLLYIGAMKSIVNGDYPISRQEARDLAGIQMQVVYGDHDPKKHKQGWIDINTFLPPLYRKDKKIEKEIYAEHKKWVGTKEMNAKYRYVQLVRSLKSYGVTFFDCKQRLKGKKKLQPVKIGITRSKIMKVEFETGKVIKEWEWSQMRRWESVRNTFTLDFGDYEDDYVNVLCEDADGMSSLIAGYIELILRTRVDASRNVEDSDEDIGDEEQMDTNYGYANNGMVTSFTAPYGQGAGQGNMADGFGRVYPHGWPQANSVDVQDLNSALRATQFLSNELGTIKGRWGKPQGMSEEEWEKQFNRHRANINKGVQDLLGQARLGVNALNRNAMDMKAKELIMEMMSMATAARNLAAYNDEHAPLLDGAKAVADSLASLMGLLGDAMDHPEDYASGLQEALTAAEKLFASAEMLLNVKLTNVQLDKGAELLLAEIIHQIDVNIDDLMMRATQGADSLNPEKKKELLEAVKKLKTIKGMAVQQLRQLAPIVIDPEAAKQMYAAGSSLGAVSSNLGGRAVALGIPNAPEVNDAVLRINRALEALMMISDLAEKQGLAAGDIDLHGPVQQLITDLAKIRADIHDPSAVINDVKAAANDQNDIVAATQALSEDADEATKERLTRAAAALTSGIKDLMESTRVLAKNAGDRGAEDAVLTVVGDLEKLALTLLGDAGAVNALNNLRYAAKVSAASLMRLTTVAAIVGPEVNDKDSRAKLSADVKVANQNVTDLLLKIKAATNEPRNFVKQNELLETALFQLPGYAELVSDAKKATQSVDDSAKRQDLDNIATETSNNLRLLAKALANVSNLSGDAVLEAALSDFDIIRADLEAAEYLASIGKLPIVPGQTKESSLALMNLSAQQLTESIDQLNTEAKKGYATGLGGSIRESATAFQQVAAAVRPLAAAITADRNIQRDLIILARQALENTVDAIAINRALAIDKDSVPKISAADKSVRQFHESVALLREASKGLATRDIEPTLRQLAVLKAKLGDKTASRPGTTVQDLQDNLRAGVKSLSVADDQLAVTAEANPDAIGYAAKVVGGACGVIIDSAAALIAIASDANRARELEQAGRTLADEASRFLQAARAVADENTPENFNRMQTAKAATEKAAAATLAIVSRGGTVGIEQAVSNILLSVAASDGEDMSVIPGTAGDILSEILIEAKRLQQIGASVVVAAKRDAASVGALASDAATAAGALVGTAKAATISDGSGQFTSLDGARIIRGADLIENDAGNEELVHRVAKQITQASGNLIAEAKARARAEPDARKRAAIVKSAQALILAATSLAHAASNSNDKRNAREISKAANNLRDKAVDLEESIRTGKKDTDTVDPALARKLVTATHAIALTTSHLLQSANAAASKSDPNAPASVLKAEKDLNEQIAQLIKVCGALNPAVQATDAAIVELKKTSVDLEASVEASQRGQQLSADIRGRTNAQIQADALAAAQKLAISLQTLQSASDAGPEPIAYASVAVKADAQSLAAHIKALAATTPDDSASTGLLNMAKNLIDALIDLLSSVQGANTGDAEAAAKLRAAGSNSQNALSSLTLQLQKGTASLEELQDFVRAILGALDTLSNNAQASGTYTKYLADLHDAVRNFSTGSTALVSVDKQNGTKTRNAAKVIADIIPVLVAAANACSATTTERSAKGEIIEATRALGQAAARMIQHTKAIAEGKSEDPQLLTAYNDANSAVAQLLATTKKGAIGELMIDKSIEQVNKAAVRVGTAALFAQAGHLSIPPEASAHAMADLVEQVNTEAKSTVSSSTAVANAVKVSDEQLGQASSTLANSAEKIANAVTLAASRVPSTTEQNKILNAARDLMNVLGALIRAARTAQRAPGNPNAQEAVAKTQSAVSSSARSLFDAMSASSAALTSHEGEIEQQKQQIISLMSSLPSQRGANFDHVIKATREVIQAAADTLYAQDQNAAIAAARKTNSSMQGLVGSVNEVMKLSTDSNITRPIAEALQQLGKAIVAQLEVSKRNRGDDATKASLDTASDKVTNSINDLLHAIKRLPGADGVQADERSVDLDALAEAELQKCAQIIANAANVLLGARPKRAAAKVPGVVDQQDINEAILDGATAIAKATGMLVQTAAAAQQERVKLVKETPGGRKYMADPAWANGLISAAQNVSGAVNQLVKAASESVQGKAHEEALTASARAVATATAHLVAASRAKSDPDSKSQQSLKNAAKAVTSATEQLVSAASAAARFQAEEIVEEDFDSDGGSKVKELEQQMLILRLEKELERARQGLNAMRKAKMADKK